MIEIVIPLTQILSVIPLEILLSLIFMSIGISILFIFRGYLQLVILGSLFVVLGFICLSQYILIDMIIPSMPTIPPSWSNVTFPISVKVT